MVVRHEQTWRNEKSRRPAVFAAAYELNPADALTDKQTAIDEIDFEKIVTLQERFLFERGGILTVCRQKL